MDIGDGNSWDPLAVENPIPVNQWVNILCTYKNKKGQIYLDGDLIASRDDMVEIIQADGKSVFGGHRNEINNNTFNGKTDDIYIYNRAFSAAKVKSLHDHKK